MQEIGVSRRTMFRWKSTRSRHVRWRQRVHAGFEDACEKLGIELRVLPPRRDCELTVEAVSPKLLEYDFFHNCQRPHAALDHLAPNEYLVAQEAA